MTRDKPIRAALLAGAVGLPLAGIATGIVALPVAAVAVPAAAVACLAGAIALPRPRPAEPQVPVQPFDSVDIRAAVDRLLDAIRGRVEPEVLDHSTRICDLVLVALESEASDTEAATDPELYRIRQTVLAYLPGALDAYLAVPGIYAHKTSNGRKSPYDTLIEQLDLMEESVRREADQVVAGETDRLEAHGRFLEAALGRSDLDIDKAGEAEPMAAEAVEPKAAQPQAVEPRAAEAEPPAKSATKTRTPAR
jgi:hypothetical protein